MNNPFVTCFLIPLIVALCSVWFTAWLLHDVYKAAVGYHIGQLNELKRECEAELPRNKVCVGKVEFVVKED